MYMYIQTRKGGWLRESVMSQVTLDVWDFGLWSVDLLECWAFRVGHLPFTNKIDFSSLDFGVLIFPVAWASARPRGAYRRKIDAQAGGVIRVPPARSYNGAQCRQGRTRGWGIVYATCRDGVAFVTYGSRFERFGTGPILWQERQFCLPLSPHTDQSCVCGHVVHALDAQSPRGWLRTRSMSSCSFERSFLWRRYCRSPAWEVVGGLSLRSGWTQTRSQPESPGVCWVFIFKYTEPSRLHDSSSVRQKGSLQGREVEIRL